MASSSSGGCSFILSYQGSAMLDSRCSYSREMIKWIIAEILRFSATIKVVLSVKEGKLACGGLKGAQSGQLLFQSPISACVHSFHTSIVTPREVDKSVVHVEEPGFVLILRANELYLHARLFTGSSPAQISEVFSSMKEGPSSSSLSTSISPDALSFEVLYIGKLRSSFRKAPPSFVDDALEKFALHEVERVRRESQAEPRPQPQPSFQSQVSISVSESEPEQEVEVETQAQEPSPPSAIRTLVKSSIPHPLQDLQESGGRVRARAPSGDSVLQLPEKSLSLPPMPRGRALSTGSAPREQVLESNRSRGDNNRTMILIVGRAELKIISPDAKTLLFSKPFREFSQISQGQENRSHFGFICREAGSGYVAYVFKTESASIASDILNVLKTASVAAGEGSGVGGGGESCDHCPMIWYRDLCSELESVGGDNEAKIQLSILKQLNSLGEEERSSILNKFAGAAGSSPSLQEQNELLMMLLRVHCESKQVKHVHDSVENRSEFLSQFLPSPSGEIFSKAKRSFDSFLSKRKGPLSPLLSFHSSSSPPGHGHGHDPSSSSPPSPSPKSNLKEDSPVASDSPIRPFRPRSSTLGSLSGDNTNIRYEIKNVRRTSTSEATGHGQGHGHGHGHSPMLNLFQKMGSNSNPTPSSGSAPTPTPSKASSSSSWRHTLFKKVISPPPPSPSSHGVGVGASPGRRQTPGSSSRSLNKSLFPASSSPPRKRTEAELRELWRSAIQQQLILIRMEKQNQRLQANQELADVKRLKLGYKELGKFEPGLASQAWDELISGNVSPTQSAIDAALLTGVPKAKRGAIWQFLVGLKKSSNGGAAAGVGAGLPNMGLSYEALLRQLTSQQHAILIDLGRTFPTHPYFSGALGSGQLALFNLLKAYSLLDADVGYCQGLSFVAGLLLMHLEEEEAFGLLRYIMFELGGRELYKPDMAELQVKLYQLTRLVHDQDPDLLLLLNHYDVLPSLYAAPWFLTLFASQFPIGFAVRVLDVLLVHGMDTIAKFAVMLMLQNREALMSCCGLEAVMDCFKSVVTSVSSSSADALLSKVLAVDWDKQLLTYAVEYSVMNDEAFHAFISSEGSKVSSSRGSPPSSGSSSASIGVQTESGGLGGEKHPIFGDLIQRQNAEIAKLTREKTELRKDVQTLLSAIVTMQKLAVVSSGGSLSLPVPPVVSEIGGKYFVPKCGTNYGNLLESSSSSNGSSQGGCKPKLLPPLRSAADSPSPPY